jgi:hypothetical protein
MAKAALFNSMWRSEVSKLNWFGYGTTFFATGFPLLWFSTALGIAFTGIGIAMLVRSHLMDGEPEIQQSPFPTLKETLDLKLAKTHSAIADLNLAKQQKEARIEGIKQRVYSEQARAEAELRADNKTFVGLVIPPEHWNLFFSAEASDEVAEAFRRRAIEVQQIGGSSGRARRAR